MKKLATVLLAAAALFSACGAAPDTAPLATPTPDPAAAAEPTPEPQNGEFYALNGFDASFNSGDAYYVFSRRLDYCLLLKIDYATATQTVCCEIPGCTHDTEDCPAYFPGEASYYIPFTAEGQLYVLMLMCGKVTNDNLIDSSHYFRDTDQYEKLMWGFSYISFCLSKHFWESDVFVSFLLTASL